MTTQTLSNKKRTLVFINIMVSCIATAMLATALTTALPSIVRDLAIPVTTAQWLTSGYSLAMGIMMPLTAFLITRFKTKRLYQSGLLVFIVGLAICSIAPGFFFLMIGRILQACGNGILVSMSQVILLTIYPMEKRGAVMGWYGLSIGAAPVIAPTISGFIVDTIGWRMIFYLALGILILTFIFACLVFSDVLETRKQPFDGLSFLLSGLAFGGVTYGVGNFGTYAWNSVHVAVPLVIGVLAGIVFVWKQNHANDPFLDLSVLKNEKYATSLVSSMVLYLAMMGSTILLPLYLQAMLGYSATLSGLITLPGSLAMMIISPFAGRIYDRIGMRKLAIVGAICLFLSNGGMFLIGLDTPIVIIILLNVLRYISIGCLMMPFVTWGMSGLPDHQTPHGTALLTAVRTVSGAIGASVFVSLMTYVAKQSVKTYGSLAQIHGLNMAFAGMAAAAFLLVLLAVFFVDKKPVIPKIIEVKER